ASLKRSRAMPQAPLDFRPLCDSTASDRAMRTMKSNSRPPATRGRAGRWRFAPHVARCGRVSDSASAAKCCEAERRHDLRRFGRRCRDANNLPRLRRDSATAARAPRLADDDELHAVASPVSSRSGQEAAAAQEEPEQRRLCFSQGTPDSERQRDSLHSSLRRSGRVPHRLAPCRLPRRLAATTMSEPPCRCASRVESSAASTGTGLGLLSRSVTALAVPRDEAKRRLLPFVNIRLCRAPAGRKLAAWQSRLGCLSRVRPSALGAAVLLAMDAYSRPQDAATLTSKGRLAPTSETSTCIRAAPPVSWCATGGSEEAGSWEQRLAKRLLARTSCTSEYALRPEGLQGRAGVRPADGAQRPFERSVRQAGSFACGGKLLRGGLTAWVSWRALKLSLHEGGETKNALAEAAPSARTARHGSTIRKNAEAKRQRLSEFGNASRCTSKSRRLTASADTEAEDEVLAGIAARHPAGSRAAAGSSGAAAETRQPVCHAWLVLQLPLSLLSISRMETHRSSLSGMQVRPGVMAKHFNAKLPALNLLTHRSRSSRLPKLHLALRLSASSLQSLLLWYDFKKATTNLADPTSLPSDSIRGSCLSSFSGCSSSLRVSYWSANNNGGIYSINYFVDGSSAYAYVNSDSVIPIDGTRDATRTTTASHRQLLRLEPSLLQRLAAVLGIRERSLSKSQFDSLRNLCNSETD
uniref:Phosphodiesterase I n=1 Tax=Macrostomum lignano TaxID=282301 RepID=A0A1I8FDE5_9PLAT